MTEPKWLTIRMVRLMHARAAAFFGGSRDVRDEALLQNSLDRPRNHYLHGEDRSLFALAAACCAGIVKNHPFIDGNKRTGLLAARAFLLRNGYLLEPDEADEVNTIVALAAGEIDEDLLAQWLAENSQPRDA